MQCQLNTQLLLQNEPSTVALLGLLAKNDHYNRPLQQDDKILFKSYTNILHFTDYVCHMTQCKCILHFIIIIQSLINRTTVNGELQ